MKAPCRPAIAGTRPYPTSRSGRPRMLPHSPHGREPTSPVRRRTPLHRSARSSPRLQAPTDPEPPRAETCDWCERCRRSGRAGNRANRAPRRWRRPCRCRLTRRLRGRRGCRGLARAWRQADPVPARVETSTTQRPTQVNVRASPLFTQTRSQLVKQPTRVSVRTRTRGTGQSAHCRHAPTQVHVGACPHAAAPPSTGNSSRMRSCAPHRLGRRPSRRCTREQPAAGTMAGCRPTGPLAENGPNAADANPPPARAVPSPAGPPSHEPPITPARAVPTVSHRAPALSAKAT